MAYKRVKGGEKNLKSGIRWTKDEIILVYKLYKELNGVGLHEHNPAIQDLAAKLGRTVRSTEAQTLMFRNLEKGGDYSHGNMNKLSREVWEEFEPKYSQIKIESDNSNNGRKKDHYEPTSAASLFNEDDDQAPNYDFWNKLLIDYYFNESKSGEEIVCIHVSNDLFQEISNYKFDVYDFFHAIKVEIGSNDFFGKLKKLHDSSKAIMINGKRLRRPVPAYFGFLIFLIYALAEDDSRDMSVANVYDRINHFGNEVLKKKWSDINTSVARDHLEPIWENLEDWSCNYLSGFKGKFIRHDSSSWNRKYVSRIERHSILNSSQFVEIIDQLIDDGFIPGRIITLEEWKAFFIKHRSQLSKAEVLLNYLSETSPLQRSILGFLNNYCQVHFLKDSISSASAKFRTPPIALKLCISSVPSWPGDPIEGFYFRAVSDDLQNDTIIVEDKSIEVTPVNADTSEEISINIDLNEGATFKSNKRRYSTNKRVYWLSKNHEFNEWRESDYPSNEPSFILVIHQDQILDNNIEGIPGVTIYPVDESNFLAVKFNSLSEEYFNDIFKIYSPYKKIEGKIELVTEFTTNRRRTLYKEFTPKFRYLGPQSSPSLTVLKSDDKEVICDLVKVDGEENLFQLPFDFQIASEFKIREENSALESSYNYVLGDFSGDPPNLTSPFLKDFDGRSRYSQERSNGDIYDIPGNFNRDSDVVKFNTWHRPLFRLFKPNQPAQKLSTKTELNLDSKGDKLLQYIGFSTNVSTYDFPKLLAELEPSVSKSYAKRIMNYWRNLGYIDFQDFGGLVKVCPSSLFFLQTDQGLRGFLTGYRSKDDLSSIIKCCKGLGIQIQITKHSAYFEDLYPSRIILFDPDGELEKFHRLKDIMSIHFVNDIQNPFNNSYVVYQLACFYIQRSVNELQDHFRDLIDYPTDHHRKGVFNIESLEWDETNESLQSIVNGAVVRFDGFKDRSVTHIVKTQHGNKVLTELHLAVFMALKSDVLLKRLTDRNGDFDLLVPLFLGLPFWLERGLILTNAEIPSVEYLKGKPYRVYKNIDSLILSVVEEKLNQNIQNYD
ncbi:hypothetical protein [Aureitalea marina]|uniref:Uncharacterized protein n=1 Tax=Aureitalea marina TaxID=930804 RepID=A0A2S7KNI1_9FLAO|nr:hypothetical protein [Aureitalea marina]PQB04123.1 hypothetical protein BST85_03805 [Aureitalea marina]